MHKYLTQEQLDQKRKNNDKRVQFLKTTKLPSSGSIKCLVKEVYNQGSEGSCTANAFCAAYRMLESNRLHNENFKPSRQYIYYKERWLEDGKNPSKITDSGADVKDAVWWTEKYGICSEDLWPYDPQKVNVEPPPQCDVEAAKHKLGTSKSIAIGDLNSIKACICDGYPVLIAIGVYKSFESSSTAGNGIVTIPNPTKYGDPNDPVDPFIGGHELTVVGYNDSTQYFTVLNSWGDDWGDDGFCYIPYSYIANPHLCYEIVVISFSDSFLKRVIKACKKCKCWIRQI